MDVAAWSAQEAERYLSPLGGRWAHTQGVAARARELALTVPLTDRHVLLAAAYVHDIGYAPDLEETGFHPLDGARWLRSRGHERLACLVAHHSGAWFEANARGLATALGQFKAERSSTADTLTYCDLTTDPEGLEVRPSVRFAEIENRYGGESEVARGLRAASETLSGMIARTEARMARLGVAV